MEKPEYLQSFYNSSIFVIPALLALVIVIGIGSFFLNIYQRATTHTIWFGNTNLCEQKEYIDLAVQHRLSYTLEHSFGVPGIKIVGDKNTIQTIREQYQQQHKDDSLTYRGVSKQGAYENKNSNTQCHLPNVKYHVENINPKLTPYIPANVDYVSYSPTSDKAVYCSYYFEDGTNAPKDIKKGSDCSFIQLTQNLYGNDELESYDISDMERLNLDQVKERYQYNLYTPNFHAVYSYVEKWEDSPTHYFGFDLATPFNGNRWGGYGEY